MTDEKTADETAEAKANAEANAKKDPKDFILERMAKREEKLKAELDEIKKDKGVLKPSDNVDDKITSAITTRLDTDAKINEFITKYPSLAEHKAKIEKYAYDPSRQGIPVETRIIEAVGVTEFIKLGATAKDQAELETRNAKMGGNSAMTDAEKTVQQEKKEVYDKAFANMPIMKMHLKS